MGALHDKTAEELALYVGPTPFLGVPLGSCWLAKWDEETRRVNGPARADVITIKPSYTRFCISIFEVKVSRSDFLSDIRSEKWRSYLPHCHRFYFATVGDIVKKTDIPDEAGWIHKGDNGWSFRKGIKARENEIPLQTLQSILFMRQRMTVRDRQIAMMEEAYRKELSGEKNELAKIIGKEVADSFAKRVEYKKLCDRAEHRLEMMKMYAESFEETLQSVPGCEPTPGWFYLHGVLERAKSILEKASQEV